MTRKLSVACGTIADLGVSLLQKYAAHMVVGARRVHLFTLERPWNNYDDGHFQIEIQRANSSHGWELWDLDMNVQPMRRPA